MISFIIGFTVGGVVGLMTMAIIIGGSERE